MQFRGICNIWTQENGSATKWLFLAMFQVEDSPSEESSPSEITPVNYPIRNQFVIYTRYRSGSSFIGELFNQHPDVFYMFEPANCIRKLVRKYILCVLWPSYLWLVRAMYYSRVTQVMLYIFRSGKPNATSDGWYPYQLKISFSICISYERYRKVFLCRSKPSKYLRQMLNNWQSTVQKGFSVSLNVFRKFHCYHPGKSLRPMLSTLCFVKFVQLCGGQFYSGELWLLMYLNALGMSNWSIQNCVLKRLRWNDQRFNWLGFVHPRCEQWVCVTHTWFITDRKGR